MCQILTTLKDQSVRKIRHIQQNTCWTVEDMKAFTLNLDCRERVPKGRPKKVPKSILKHQCLYLHEYLVTL